MEIYYLLNIIIMDRIKKKILLEKYICNYYMSNVLKFFCIMNIEIKRYSFLLMIFKVI